MEVSFMENIPRTTTFQKYVKSTPLLIRQLSTQLLEQLRGQAEEKTALLTAKVMVSSWKIYY